MHRLLKPFINCALSVGILIYVMSTMNLDEIITVVTDMPSAYFVLALSVPLLSSVIHVTRWQCAGRLFRLEMPFTIGWRLVFIGYFFNQVLPSAFGGDFMRAWGLRKQCYPWIPILGSILVDRLIGLFTLCLLYVVFYPLMRTVFDVGALDWIWVGLLLGLFAMALLCSFPKALIKILGQFSLGKKLAPLMDIKIDAQALLTGLGVGVLIHLGIGLTFYILALGLGIPLSFSTAVLLFPLINLVTMIPLSFAGWGVREGVLVYSLPMIGIAAEQAFALSVSYGIVLTLSALPGILVWWFHSSFDSATQPCVSAE